MNYISARLLCQTKMILNVTTYSTIHIEIVRQFKHKPPSCLQGRRLLLQNGKTKEAK